MHPRAVATVLRRLLLGRVHRRPARVPGGVRLVSFSFDDAPRSAVTTGAGLLEARGARGTFYVAPGLVGRDEPDPVPELARFAELAARGHEIGDHTHAHVDLAGLDAGGVADELARGRDELIAAGCPPATSMAYPYGSVSVAAKGVAASRYRAARGIRPGVHRGTIDLAHLHGVSLYSRPGHPDPRRWVDEVGRGGGWVIVYTHEVRPDPGPYGSRPDDLARVIDAALAADVEVVTVGEALARIAG